ncbi:cache domain-containing sensor histidine kinase [Oceanivirga miroungae]|uniref:Sigma factor AlgU n=1 Tax=Oceanivirga miroungae TaxID=1130046 RepID=A0A6I8MFA4_9FUSO|nr:sensor histidine kinase [Oceanivirga miroungae]VWL85977.1 sigma factor AlgU [Oceanivirga miroungae]
MKTLKSRMMIYYGLASMFILTVSSILLLSFLNSQIIKIESEKLEASVDSSSKYIALYITNLKKEIEFISQIKEVRNYIKGNDVREDRVKNILNNIKEKDKFIEKISIVTTDGKNVSNGSGNNKNMGLNMLEKKWYKDAISEGVILNPTREKHYKGMDSWVLSLSKNVKEDDKQALILLDLQYIALYEYLKSINLGNKGQVYIVDDKNNIIFANDIEKKKPDIKVINKIKHMHFGYNEVENAIYFNSKIKGTNLEILGISSGEKILDLKSNVFKIIFFAFIVSSISVMIITKIISDRLTKSLDELKRFMQNMDDRLENIVLNETTFSEIEILKQEINNMIDKIKQLKKYEIDSLYSQINPHFLYNTLDILIWMIEFEDNEKAIKITKNLSNFFRISLSQGKRVISLEDELKHSENYLEIQKERYQNKLEYIINYKDKSLLECQVPKIIIQPLVENAIYHGIKEIDGVGKIEINVYERSEDLYIEIKDNGIGINNSHKNKLKLGGVGMKNIDRRIKYYYGEEYGLSIENTNNIGTTVVLKLKKVL